MGRVIMSEEMSRLEVTPHLGFTPYTNPDLSEFVALNRAGICHWCKTRPREHAGTRFCAYCHEALNAANQLERDTRQYVNDQLARHRAEAFAEAKRPTAPPIAAPQRGDAEDVDWMPVEVPGCLEVRDAPDIG